VTVTSSPDCQVELGGETESFELVRSEAELRTAVITAEFRLGSWRLTAALRAPARVASVNVM